MVNDDVKTVYDLLRLKPCVIDGIRTRLIIQSSGQFVVVDKRKIYNEERYNSSILYNDTNEQEALVKFQENEGD